MDVIALHQAGFDCAVASLGTSLTEEQARMIARHTKQIIISYDADGAGQAALLAVLSPILRETCFPALCGVSGALAVLGASLSVRRSPCALAASLGLSAALSALPALIWGLPVLSAVILSALGWAAGALLWLACLTAKRLAPCLL